MPCDLAIVSVVKDEERYLEEWMDYHRSIGVERFFLYDNLSTDRTAELAADLGATVRSWPDRYFQQITAHYHALSQHQDDVRWLAFVDPDEYVFTPGQDCLPDLLDEYRDADALGICWACFGTSYHAVPQASTPRSYLRRSAPNLEIGGMAINRHIKSIVQPGRVPLHNPPTPHHFYCRTVDVHGREINGPYVPEPVWDGVRLNHYISRSEEEAHAKMLRPNVNTRLLYDYDLCSPELNAVLDDSMLTHVENLDSRAKQKERG